MPLVSVIMPIYNTEDYLAEALDSVINQTYKNIEIICINDGSKDGSLNIIEEYAAKDARIIIHNQDNKGLPATKNVGIQLARGKYITFVDSDDTISLNTIETSVKIAESKDCDIVVNYLNLTQNYIANDISRRPWMSAPQPFIKKEVFDKYNIRFDEDLTTGEDIIFSHKLLALTNKVALNQDSFYFYRIREGQMTDKKNDSRFLFCTEQWFEKLTTFYNARELWEESNNHIVNFLKTQIIPNYSGRDLGYDERKKLFNMVHDFCTKNNINVKIQIVKPLDFVFVIFMICNKSWQYEPIRLFIRFIIKTASQIKSISRIIKR